jgi:hypothetical protein
VDIAYVAGTRRPSPDPLVWSLRTMAYHYPVDRVYIAGGLPRALDPNMVHHLPTAQRGHKWGNLAENLRAIVASDIGDTFIYMNDDFFVVADVDSIPLMDRGPLDAYCETLRERGGADHQEFVVGMRAQRDLLRQWGYIDPPCTDLHAPQPTDKARMAELLERVARDHPDHPVGHWRALYGAGLDSVTIRDPKHRGEITGTYWSSSPQSWRDTEGQWIRDRYWRPSPWEAR